MARPMPRLAPVTSALRPVNCRSMTCFLSPDQTDSGRHYLRGMPRRPARARPRTTPTPGRWPTRRRYAGMPERVRPVAGLEVHHRAAPGGLGPADEVAGRRVLPRRTGSRRAQHLVIRLPERPGRSVRPQQRHDVRGEHRAAVQLVAQLEVIHPGAHRMIRVAHTRAVYRAYRNPESGQLPAAQRARRVVVAAAQHLGPARPGGPAGQRVVQEHEALARVEQLGKPPSHVRQRAAPAAARSRAAAPGPAGRGKGPRRTRRGAPGPSQSCAAGWTACANTQPRSAQMPASMPVNASRSTR